MKVRELLESEDGRSHIDKPHAFVGVIGMQNFLMKFDSGMRGTGGRGSGKAGFHRGGGGGEQRDNEIGVGLEKVTEGLEEMTEGLGKVTEGARNSY